MNPKALALDARKFLRKIVSFHPAIGLPLVFGIGVSMVLADHYRVADLCVFVVVLWSIGLWVLSGQVAGAKSKSQKLPNKKHKMPPGDLAAIMLRKKREYLFFLWKPVIAMLLLVAAIIGACEYGRYQWELGQNFGLLTPASDPMPKISSKCITDPPPTAMRVYAGGGMSWSNQQKFALVTIGKEDVLWLSRKGKKVVVSGDIYTPEGDLVHIDENSFETPQYMEFKPKRPDKHTLKVFDKWHQAVLDIRLLNDHAIRVRGQFWKRGRSYPVTLDDESVKWADSSVGIGCFSEVQHAIGMP